MLHRVYWSMNLDSRSTETYYKPSYRRIFLKLGLFLKQIPFNKSELGYEDANNLQTLFNL